MRTVVPGAGALSLLEGFFATRAGWSAPKGARGSDIMRLRRVGATSHNEPAADFRTPQRSAYAPIML
jgi:hypothetical protein